MVIFSNYRCIEWIKMFLMSIIIIIKFDSLGIDLSFYSFFKWISFVFYFKEKIRNSLNLKITRGNGMGCDWD